MTTKKNFNMSLEQRQHRHFSDNFKKQKVNELTIGLTQVRDLVRQYEVSSTSVYRWIAKFGSMKQKKERIIVENESDTKELLALKKRIAELEQIVGQKQILLDFKDKMIEIAEQMYNVDIKKKLGSQPFDGTGSTEKR
jgi:transposase-like protein